MSRKLVVLGMMAKIPVPGVLWQTLHYLVGFERLGFETYYVEAHARTPGMLMEHETDDGSGRAADLLEKVLTRFDLGGRWAYHALHHDGRCYGMSERRLRRLYREAELILNLHGATAPWSELQQTGRLVYLETDPVRLQIELHDGLQESIDFLDAHVAHFTFAENLGTETCTLPVSGRVAFRPTRQPVVLDFWRSGACRGDVRFTTIGNWRQRWRSVTYEGETYGWSKDEEWQKVLDLPVLTGRAYELCLSGHEPADERELESRGWRVTRALDLTLDSYRDYIRSSTAEFTVAKDQNVRFRTGWFSDRSATYLAAGRPVVTQDTGFGRVLPTGEGLFAFRDVREAAAAVHEVAAAPKRHGDAAAAIAREHFDAERVLTNLLGDLGISVARSRPAAKRNGRRKLGPDSTVLALVPHYRCEGWLEDCLASLEAQTRPLDGIVVIDDASDAPPVELVRRHPRVTLLHAAENVGPYRLVQQVMDDTDYDAYLFQDADDWSSPERLERLLEGAARTGAELIGSQEVRVFCDEPEVVPITWPLDGNAPFAERPTAFTCLHPTSLVSRDLVAAVGGFATGLRFGGDAEFLRRVHWIAKVANVPHYGYYRRIRQNSLTTAPATAIGTPVRKQLMEETFARANENAARVARGEAPDLTPLRTAPSVELRHLAGPKLRAASTPSRALRRRARSKPATPAARPGRPPGLVFVLGADRSGASALACALGEHPTISLELHGGWLGRVAAHLDAARDESLVEDSAVFGAVPPDTSLLTRAVHDALAASGDGRIKHVVHAAWQHTLAAERLAERFPDARFIHVVRDVHSVVRALSDPPLGTPGATGGTQIPTRLRTKVTQEEAVSRWVGSVEASLDAEAVAPDRFLTVRYADLIAAPDTVVARCLAFLGEKPAPQCLRPLRGLQTLVDGSRLEASIDPSAWRQARRLSDELCGIGKAARVVMVTDHFPKVSETFFVDKFLGLRDRGWDVHVVAQRSNKEHWEFFPTLRDDVGDLDERLHVVRDELEAKLDQLQPDIVHFGYGALAAGRMHLREALGCRIVVSFRGFDLNSFRLDDPVVYDDVWRSADMLHLVSEDLWQRAQRRGCPPARPHVLVRDAVDVTRLRPPQRHAVPVGTPERPLRLVSVGRLHWKKGHEYALGAVRALLDRGVSVAYRIVGDGDHRDATEFAIRDLGLEDRVELLGSVATAGVRDLYAWADVMVHPSITEAFGVAAAEAQAMALPVVCSDAGGLPENVVDGVTGFVVPRRDSAALAASIFELATDHELRLRMGRAARRHAEKELALEHQLDRFEQLYAELLASPGPARRLSLQTARSESRRQTLDALREQVASGRADAAAGEALWRREVVERVRVFVDRELPVGARVLVVSRGDDAIVDFERQQGEHFPQASGGVYAGHHPADSADAIARLEELRRAGAQYLVIPGTSAWWLDHYVDFRAHLERTCRAVAAEDRMYRVFALNVDEAVAAA